MIILNIINQITKIVKLFKKIRMNFNLYKKMKNTNKIQTKKMIIVMEVILKEFNLVKMMIKAMEVILQELLMMITYKVYNLFLKLFIKINLKSKWN